MTTATAPTAVFQVTVLHGHVSPETAFVQGGYPYGRLRCHRRIWVETAVKGAAKGQHRVNYQTTNPKRYGPGRYGEGPEGHPWNAPHPSTYSDWVVLYLDENEHVQVHGGSFIYGISGGGDAHMRLDGTYDQLTDAERRWYGFMVKVGQRGDRWDGWYKAVAWIKDQYTETGEYPAPEQVTAAPGFYLASHEVPWAVAWVAAEAVTAGA
jgi:hypothetical protein